ncbi:AAA family ATPase [Streptomyces altiplanensis]
MTHKGQDFTGRLRSRLVASRDRAFVGREAETALFRAMLRGEPDVAPVLFLHGPGGIGKSTLLRRFAREAAAAVRTVVEVDARTTDPTPESFERAAADVLDLPGAVLLIDTFEMCQGLEGWLWERFLPELPLGAVAVLAGRTRPDSRWTSDTGWSDHLRVVPLKALSADDSVKFLSGQGVPARAHGDVLAFTGGHPLALSLAAAVAREEAEDGGDRRPGSGPGPGWAPDQDVIGTLLTRLADHPPSPLHRQALEVCAHAYVTSEELLRAMFGERAPELFAWLRAQPYIETAATGVFPHDVVREALEADLRWRDPEGFVAMHLRMHDHLLDRLRKGPAHQLMPSVAALMYMYRTDGHMPEVHEWQAPGRVQELPYAPADQAAVLELTEQAEGAESAEIARRWLELHPCAFRVHRSTRTGRPVAFTATFWLAPDEEEAPSAFDPVIAAAWRRARRLRPVRPGERMAVTRFMVHPPLYHRPSAPMTLMHWRALGEVWRDTGGLTHHFAVYRDDDYWDSHMSHYGMAKDEEPVHVGHHAYRLFGRDYRTGLEEYLAASTDAMLAADGAPGQWAAGRRGDSAEPGGGDRRRGSVAGVGGRAGPTPAGAVGRPGGWSGRVRPACLAAGRSSAARCCSARAHCRCRAASPGTLTPGCQAGQSSTSVWMRHTRSSGTWMTMSSREITGAFSSIPTGAGTPLPKTRGQCGKECGGEGRHDGSSKKVRDDADTNEQ